METLSISNIQLDRLLTASAAHHHRVCPRQVLGVRIGLFAGYILEIPLPQPEKRLLAIVETDGCFVDGVSVATGCFVGRRTLRIEDYGKTAVTFVDTFTGQAIRIAPHASERLLHWQPVTLTVPLQQLIGQAGKRVSCEVCGEEVINQREVRREGSVLCRSCAGESYFWCSPPSC